MASVYVWLTPFKLGDGIHSPPGFPSLLPQISTNQLQIFCVFKLFTMETCSDQNEVNYFSEGSRDHSCGKRLTHFSLYSYRFFSFYFFSFLMYLVLNGWKNTVGHLFYQDWNLENLLLTSALFKKYRILIIFLAYFNPEFDNCMTQLTNFWLKCNEQHSSISKN